MKKKLLIFLALVLFIPFVINAEELKMEWQKNWGGEENNGFDLGLPLEDGGYIAITSSYSTDIEGITNNGSSDVFMIKYDKDGNIIWQKNWGGNSFEDFFDVIQTEDKGFIAVGESRSQDIDGLIINNSILGIDDAIIVRFDENGNVLWQKSFGGTSHDEYLSVISTEDDEFIAIGESISKDIDGLPNKGDRDVIIVKYDKNGNLVWKKSIGDRGTDRFTGSSIIEDNNFIVAINGTLLVKFDKDGNIIWQRGSDVGDYDYFNELLVTSTNDIIVAGIVSSDAAIVKYDKDGSLLWYKTWGGNGYEEISSIVLTERNEIIAVGSFSSRDIAGMPINNEQDAMILKYDKNGNMEWQQGYCKSTFQKFEAVDITKDGNIITVGYYATIYDEYPENNQIMIVSIIKKVKSYGKRTMVAAITNLLIIFL